MTASNKAAAGYVATETAAQAEVQKAPAPTEKAVKQRYASHMEKETVYTQSFGQYGSDPLTKAATNSREISAMVGKSTEMSLYRETYN